MSERPTRYRSLAEDLARALHEGRYPPGSQLPSVRQLCAEHGASLATVTHALHELEDAGLIEARARRGHFVRGAVRAPVPAGGPSLELEGRRKRLIELATTRPDSLSLSHLALPAALLPLAALQRHLQQALAADRSLLAIGSVYGSDALRQALAHRMLRAGCAVDAEDIVVTHGEGEALELCLRLLTRPGDIVAVPEPGSLRALELVASLGLKPLAIPAPQDGGFSVPALAFALQHHDVRCCVVDPSFDTVRGSRMPDAAREQLAALLREHRLPLIECELMGELQRSGERPRPVKAWDTEDRVLYCASLACVTGAGFSVGWVASRRHRLQLRAARAVHGELLSPLTDAALAGFLADRGYETHLRRLRRTLAAQTEAWVEAARRWLPPDTRVTPGEGGYVIWVELPPGVDSAALLPRLRERGYGFVPGTAFGAGAALASGLRLSAAHPLDAQREQGLRRLGELLREPGRDTA
ncbi:aminotransferase-like domain-containing protein [Rubrivivax gelatinosus]|uniref:DNA-binding transcriptional MocR family regulator n=1 Tax=Rubrivivax gelatinosus TaxID=28068 RepID=A0A4R2MB34_RUBGE|nr:PLP-dependent aminotransferase family protein [Rubrivivax gelatinosus]MBK1690137.1 GntR family transcriptional regulator [Rubrivivax gelatinosus]TCP04569.1 DNA-binding transcriptional MocR family regulator [Rubrivivax gelatinosus]